MSCRFFYQATLTDQSFGGTFREVIQIGGEGGRRKERRAGRDFVPLKRRRGGHRKVIEVVESGSVGNLLRLSSVGSAGK